MASIAHPTFSLSTKADHRMRCYENEPEKVYREMKLSSDGQAKIHDQAVLIYCSSQIMAVLNKGRQGPAHDAAQDH